MVKAGLIGVAWLLLYCGQAKAYVLVEDVPNLTNNAINEARNYAQYLSQTANQLTQITNQATQIGGEPAHRAEAVR